MTLLARIEVAAHSAEEQPGGRRALCRDVDGLGGVERATVDGDVVGRLRGRSADG